MAIVTRTPTSVRIAFTAEEIAATRDRPSDGSAWRAMMRGAAMSVYPTPSVGRIVHYVAFGTPGGEYPEGTHRAAIVTEVEPSPPDVDEPKNVSLCVFNPTGMHFREDVPFDPEGKPGTWHWPERERV
jgi:hypothetical protein